MNELAHSQPDALAFLQAFERAFTSKPNGLSWPNHERTWLNASKYIRGLIRPGNNTVTDIADNLYTDAEQLERFVRESPWEHDEVERHLHEQVPEAMQGEDAALIVDGMPIPKRGTRSVGAARQWCSVLGKVDNCQVTVNTILARPGPHDNTDQVHWPLAMRLFLTKKWAGDKSAEYDSPEERRRYAELRESTGIPEDVAYQPKYDIALEQVERAIAAGVKHDCVVGDIGFGRPRAFREGLRELEEPYALEVEPGKFNVVPEDTEILEPDGQRKHPVYPEEVEAKTPDAIAAGVEASEAWTEVAWNEGSKETLSGEFYRTRVRVVEKAATRWVSEETGWLLLKKNHGTDDEDDADGEVRGLKAWICWDLDERSLDELVDRSQLRWTIERYHQDSKGDLGAGEYQGRTWAGFHHHLAAVMLAHAFLAEQRLERGIDREDLPSFQQVVRDIVKENATQDLMAEQGFDRPQAEEIAVQMLSGYSDWKGM